MLRAFNASYTFFFTSGLFLIVDILALYVTFILCDYICYKICQPLGEILVKVPCLKSIMELPHEHLLVWVVATYGSFIETCEVFPQ